MKMIKYLLAITSLCILYCFLEAAGSNEKSKDTNVVNQTKGNSSATEEKYNREKYYLMERDEIDNSDNDEIDNSDTLSNPFDDSEFEDEDEEEDTNRDED